MVLDDAIRGAVGRDLDALAVELDSLRRQVSALRAAARLAPADREVRQARAVQLRQEGLSTRAIAMALNVHRATVTRDVAGVPAPELVFGLDGRRTRGPRPAAGS